MKDDRNLNTCHCCEKITNCYECPRCNELTCENCFVPMAHNATEPVVDCVACDMDSEREHCARSRSIVTSTKIIEVK